MCISFAAHKSSPAGRCSFASDTLYTLLILFHRLILVYNCKPYKFLYPVSARIGRDKMHFNYNNSCRRWNKICGKRGTHSIISSKDVRRWSDQDNASKIELAKKWHSWLISQLEYKFSRIQYAKKFTAISLSQLITDSLAEIQKNRIARQLGLKVPHLRLTVTNCLERPCWSDGLLID